MLDGINVLNEYFIMKEFPIGCLLSLIVLYILGIICISISGLKNKLIGILFLFCAILSMVIGYTIQSKPSDIKEYQVTIDESVSMVDFTNKYDIIRVDGEIYTIREKE